jgi:hypothetical protein
VQQLGRRIIGSMTSAFVLLCSIYCACGDAGSAGTSSCHVSAAAEAAPSKPPPCHGHADATCPSGRDERGEDRSHERHQGEGGCGHCQPTLTSVESSKAPARSPPTALAIELVTFAVPPLQEQTTLHTPTCSGDLPPPQGRPSLLSLHCALNM